MISSQQILIIGPYQFVHPTVRMEHAETARDLAMQLMMKGHLAVYGHWQEVLDGVRIDPNSGQEQVMNAVEIADALLVISESRDVHVLVEKARNLEMPIYYSIDEVPGG